MHDVIEIAWFEDEAIRCRRAPSRPPPEPVIDLRDRSIGLRYPEVVHPAPEVLGKLIEVPPEQCAAQRTL